MTRIEIVLDKSVYTCPDSVNAQIIIVNERQMNLKRLVCEIKGMEEISYLVTVTQYSGSGQSSTRVERQTDSKVFFHHTFNLFDPNLYKQNDRSDGFDFKPGRHVFTAIFHLPAGLSW